MGRYRHESVDRLCSSASVPRHRPAHGRTRGPNRAEQNDPATAPDPPVSGAGLRVLYIEDNPDDALLIASIIEQDRERPVELSTAATLRDGMRVLESARLDVVLLDLHLPDCSGIETVKAVVRDRPELPLVVLTGTDDEQLAVRAVHAGAQDYLVKNDLEASVLSRTLRHAIERQRLLLELKRAHARAHHHAMHDALTGLGNRHLLLDTLQHSLDKAERYEEMLAVLFVDIDGFKLYNDTSGHTEGDRLLKGLGDVLKSAVRRSDFVARLGGDEFVIVLTNITRTENAARVAQTVLDQFSELHVAVGDVEIGLSIGITIFPIDGVDAPSMLRRADLAMYAVKRSGGNAYHFYSAAIEAEGTRRIALEADLAEVVTSGQLALQYQPVIDIERRTICGVEALIRWNHPRLGTVAPSEFIPIAEDTGRIASIGDWTLEEACRQLSAWSVADVPNLQMAVNVSQKQLGETGLVQKIRNVLRANHIDARALTIEVTESGLAKDMECAIEVLGQLRELGITVLIDDFGTGYSSLVALRRLPVDGLKIDRSFLHGLAGEKNVRIVEGILAMARTLDLKVIAEGVETAAELNFLRDRWCRFYQGYYFSQAMDPHELEPALSRDVPL